MTDEPTLQDKLAAVRQVALYRPEYAVVILGLKLFAALFEGVGVLFLVPIIEVVQAGGDPAANGSGAAVYFVRAYDLANVPVTLETLLLGLAAVMTVRFSVSFLIGWLQASLTATYMAHLRQQAYEHLLSAELAYVDGQDTDDITNTIITETRAAANVINDVLGTIENLLFAAVYTVVALALSPGLTVTTVVILGTVAVLTRYVLESGYDIGDRVAAANERIQSLVHAGIRGLPEVKLFTMQEDLTRAYASTHDRLVDTRVRLQRNQVALRNFNQLLNVLVVFGLVYLAIEYLALTFGALGAFLFAVFRLSPLISNLNNTLYAIDGALPHLVRTQWLVDELDRHAETSPAGRAPASATPLAADDVSFRYDAERDGTDVTAVSLRVERGETVALVGPSGAGKSTIVSLLAGLYTPDEGQITANDVPLSEIGRDTWYDRVTVVPQRPFLFNETLRYNVSIGDPDVDDDAVERACAISQVSAFLEELPDGLDTELGDDGVRLSGGQRQRVAIARALLSEADVLILDEATSELDSPTEAAILEGIEAMNRTYATIVIGHWLSTIRDADRIYTVVDGEIVESGTHEALIATDSAYAKLYESQVEVSQPP